MKNCNFFLLSGYSRSCNCNLFINVWCWYFSSSRQCVALTNTHFLYHHSWLMLFLLCILSLHEAGCKHVCVCRGFISSCNFSPPETCLSLCHITLDCILNTAFKKSLLIITWGLWMILLSFREDFWCGRDIVCYYWKSPWLTVERDQITDSNLVTITILVIFLLFLRCCNVPIVSVFKFIDTSC